MKRLRWVFFHLRLWAFELKFELKQWLDGLSWEQVRIVAEVKKTEREPLTKLRISDARLEPLSVSRAWSCTLARQDHTDSPREFIAQAVALPAIFVSITPRIKRFVLSTKAKWSARQLSSSTPTP